MPLSKYPESMRDTLAKIPESFRDTVARSMGWRPDGLARYPEAMRDTLAKIPAEHQEAVARSMGWRPEGEPARDTNENRDAEAAEPDLDDADFAPREGVQLFPNKGIDGWQGVFRPIHLEFRPKAWRGGKSGYHLKVRVIESNMSDAIPLDSVWKFFFCDAVPAQISLFNGHLCAMKGLDPQKLEPGAMGKIRKEIGQLSAAETLADPQYDYRASARDRQGKNKDRTPQTDAEGRPLMFSNTYANRL
jgi:hypothetical protein